MKILKKLTALILAIALAVSGLYLTMPEGKIVEAAIAEETQTTDNGVFSVKLQAREHRNEENAIESVDLRLVSSVDSLDYKNVGFEIYLKADASNPTAKQPIVYKTSTVLNRISAVSTGVEYKYSPKVVDAESMYFITGTIMGIGAADLTSDFYVRAFYTAQDNSVTYGVGRYFNIADATQKNIINTPVKIAKADLPEADVTTGKIAVKLAGKETSATVESWVDGYAHLNVDVPAEATLAPSGVTKVADKDKLASANLITVGSASAIYRNLQSTYKNNGADASWYTVYDAAGYNKFVIATDADLEGLRAQVNGGTTFASGSAQDTIYMISNIELNDKGTVDWATGTIAQDSSINQWDKGIGYYNNNKTPKAFSGVFDGQGHTISGVYCVGPKNGNDGIGLFGYAGATGMVQNLRLENSFFSATGAANHQMGSIVGRCEGTIQNVYSNATVKALGSYAGGLAGFATATIKESWYEGNLLFAANNKWQCFGGITGYLSATGNLENCLNSGKITRESGSSTPMNIGGLVGQVASGATVKKSLFTGTMTLSGSVGANGLLIGTGTPTTITDTYAVQGASTSTVAGSNLTSYQGVVTSTMNGYDALTATAATKATLPEGETAVKVNIDFYDSVNNPNGKWTMRNGKTPALQSWVTSDALYYPDTTFVKDAEGNLLISSPEELYGFAKLVNDNTVMDQNESTTYASAKVKLTNNIRLNETAASTYDADTVAKYTWISIGGWSGGSKIQYTGTFDGQGKTISGLYCQIANVKNHGVGFVGALGAGGRITNLKLTNSYFNATTAGNVALGSIAGYSKGNIDKVYSDAIVKAAGSFVGGIVGYNGGAIEISESWFAGSVEAGGTSVGGILGNAANNATITNCLNSGSIYGKYSTGYVGGLIGNANTGTTVSISDSMSTGTVKAVSNTRIGTVIGDIAGTCKVTFTNVYALQDPTYTKEVGNGSLQTTSVNHKQYTKEQMTGYQGYINIDSFFWDDPTTETVLDGKWAIRNDDTPALARFTSIGKQTYQNGYYTIGSADDLYGFADAFNAGKIPADADVKLTANITLNPGSPDGGTPDDTTDDWSDATVAAGLRKWTSIGGWSGGSKIQYTGTFDGQGKTISGLYCQIANVKNHGVGLVGALGAGGRITNLKLTNSYFNATTAGNVALGSIAGYSKGNIDKVYSDAIVKAAGSFVGGIVGYNGGAIEISESWFAGSVEAGGTSVGGILGNAANNATITNCLNSGSVYGKYSTGYVGGLIGNANTGMTVSISDSMSTGTVKASSNTRIGTVIGDIAGTCKVTFTNVYALKNPTYTKEVGNGSLQTTSVNHAQYTEEELTGYKGFINIVSSLWDDPTTETALDGKWAIRNDDTPALARFTSIGKQIYQNGYYTIGSASDLYGFSDAFNAGKIPADADAKLTANITLNPGSPDGGTSDDTTDDWSNATIAAGLRKWTPIGGWSGGSKIQYTGTFDGQGKTISGLYCQIANVRNHGVGLVGALGAGGRITNLKLTNSYFHCTGTANAILGSIAGYSKGNIDKVYSDAIVKAEPSMAGGLVGYNGGAIEISESWFAGSVEAGGTNVGGILGNAANSVTITNCLNSGSVYGKYTEGTAFTGGLIGSGNSGATVSISNSMSTGTVKAISKVRVGTVIGDIASGCKVTFSNVYALKDETYIKAVGNGSLQKNSEAAQQYTEEELTGDLGYNNIDGDLWEEPDGKWIIRNNDTPVLARFRNTKMQNGVKWFAKETSYADHHDGAFGGLNIIDEDSVRILAQTSTTSEGHIGFMLKKEVIKSIIDDGYKSVAFKVTTETYGSNDTPGFVNVYTSGVDVANYHLSIDNGTRSGTEDIFYASGSVVEIDLVKLYNDANFTEGLKFVLTKAAASGNAAGAPAYLVLSDLLFAKIPAATNAFEQMTSKDSYASYENGEFGGVAIVEGNSVQILAKEKNGVSGFMLHKNAVAKMLQFGVNEMTLTLNPSAYNSGSVPQYVVLDSTATIDYVVNHETAVAKVEGNKLYFEAGTEITIRLDKLYADITDEDGLKFALLSGDSWESGGTTAYLTLANLTFPEKLQKLNLDLVTSNDDFGQYYENEETWSLMTKKSIEAVADAGFKYVDLSLYRVRDDGSKNSELMQDGWEDIVYDLQALAEELDIEFRQAHSPGYPTHGSQEWVDTNKRSIDVCSMLGIENLVVHAQAQPTKAKFYEVNLTNYKLILDYASERGVNILCENSTYVNSLNWNINDGADMREFIKYVQAETGNTNFHGCWDTGHGHCEGSQFLDMIALGDEMYAIHVADNMGDKDSHLTPYYGNMDIDEVIRALRVIGFDGYFTLETTGTPRITGTYTGPELEGGLDPYSTDRFVQQKIIYQIATYILRKLYE